MDNLVERFWPSLLDRLTETEGGPHRPEDDHFIDRETLRDRIKRDILLLLNSPSLESHLAVSADPAVRDGFERFDRIRNAVVNYGIPAIVGQQSNLIDKRVVEVGLRNAIIAFEPRIQPRGLHVRVTNARDDGKVEPSRPIEFEIHGSILATPAPEQLCLRSRWDLALGEASLTVEA